ncbi:hypothetical protein RSSM_03273 [Rhodopirellula sallentina SM41]|uniref:Uncharacterized protein n=1 Tax=Rhodopirellula sallentina SM41 TaxID=1263870 RepID=M5U1V2_9BACT|nr:hypothetical protein RSSM_03273 [Rhodopirellula sallentina SM41]
MGAEDAGHGTDRSASESPSVTSTDAGHTMLWPEQPVFRTRNFRDPGFHFSKKSE